MKTPGRWRSWPSARQVLSGQQGAERGFGAVASSRGWIAGPPMSDPGLTWINSPKTQSAWLSPNEGGFREADQNNADGLGCRRSRMRDDGIGRMVKRRRSSATTPPWRFHGLGILCRSRRGTRAAPSRFLHSRPVLCREIHCGDCRGVGSEQGRDGCRDTDRPKLHQAATNRAGWQPCLLNRSRSLARPAPPLLRQEAGAGRR